MNHDSNHNDTEPDYTIAVHCRSSATKPCTALLLRDSSISKSHIISRKSIINRSTKWMNICNRWINTCNIIVTVCKSEKLLYRKHEVTIVLTYSWPGTTHQNNRCPPIVLRTVAKSSGFCNEWFALWSEKSIIRDILIVLNSDVPILRFVNKQ